MSFNSETNRIEMVSFSARGSMKMSVKPVYLNELKEVTAKIHEAMCMLYSIILGKELPPMWERDA